jgi:RNA polymerase sigma-70 factor (ECF subfamily)
MPDATLDPADPHEPLPEPIGDPIWLDPLPDVYLDGYIVNPEARYEARESITLAFLTALQRLPGRQQGYRIKTERRRMAG